jgi:hypothetical protein
MCNKISFGSKKEAMQHARHTSRNRGRGRKSRHFRAYRCPRCQQVHLTSQSKAEHRRVRASLKQREVRA